MPLFKRNPNESAYAGGKKHITDVLKNRAPESAVLYRLPEEDFNTGSTLVVMPGEEAVFVHRGGIEQVFSEGTHVLTTENYPFLSRLRNSISGGISVYSCVVIFVRTASTRQIEWGDQASVRDPVWHIQTDLGIGGTYRIRVKDAAALIRGIFGSGRQAMEADELNDYFSSQMKTRIKSNIVRAIQQAGVEILGIEANLDGFSEALQQLFVPMFENDGISLLSFSIDRMTILDSDVRTRLEESFGKNTAMEYMGDNWARDQLAQAIHEIARNTGSGALANSAAGLGMGMAAIPLVSSMLQQIPGSALSLADIMRKNAAPRPAQADAAAAGHGAPESPASGAAPSDEANTAAAGCFCGSCGKSNPRGTRFCGWCGKALSAERRCAVCGSLLAPGAWFCGMCGTRYEDSKEG